MYGEGVHVFLPDNNREDREVEFAELLHGGDVSLIGAGVGRVQQPAGLVQVSRHEILH